MREKERGIPGASQAATSQTDKVGKVGHTNEKKVKSMRQDVEKQVKLSYKS